MSFHIDTWERCLGAIKEDRLEILEIGSFEGRSAIFFLSFFENSQLVCIDTFTGSTEHHGEDAPYFSNMNEVERRFDANLRPFGDRVLKLKQPSITALPDLKRRGREFDIVYVDGDHRAASVHSDATLSWSLLKDGGIMILDDYRWMPDWPADQRPQAGIDAFLSSIEDDFEELHRGYQIIIRKAFRAHQPGRPDLSITGHSIATRSGGVISPPLVSFVLINWNYGRFVGAAIDSILQQDYPHFECLVVDNCSTDNSRDVIARHVGNDGRFRVAHLPENIGQLGAAFWALDKVDGGFVTFVDADDVIFSNFASAHLQAHLAVPQSVAITSSNIADIDQEGRILQSKDYHIDIKQPGAVAGLGPVSKVLRLTAVSDRDYVKLSAATATAPRRVEGWIWSPGTGNMYRRSVLNLAKIGDGTGIFMRPADAHFNRLCHVFGGTALVDMVLSGYRLHGNNYFARRESIPGLMRGTQEYSISNKSHTLETLEFFVENIEQFKWNIEPHYWDAIEYMAASHSGSYKRDEAVIDLFKRHAPKIIDALGPSTFARKMLDEFGPRRGMAIVRAGFKDSIPAMIRLRIVERMLSQAFRKKRKKKPRKISRATAW